MPAWFGLALLALPALAATPIRGPYLQAVTDSSAVVVVDLDVEGAVDVSAEPGGHAVSSASALHHEVLLTGLTPATTYTWSVQVDAVGVAAELTLETAAGPDAPFSFLVIGDTRSDHTAHEAIVAAALEEEALFALNTGDLVSDGEDITQWDTFLTIEQPLMQRIPLFPVIGNHDEYGGTARHLTDAFVLPGNEEFYSFDWGNAHFIVLDGHVNGQLVCAVEESLATGCLNEEQVAWLQADLDASCDDPDRELTFVFIHIGPYSSKEGRDGNAQLRSLLPLLAEHGVTAVISGHDHYYERGTSFNGLPYVITGGGGAPLYATTEPNDAPHTVAHTASIHHYLKVDIDGTTVQLTALGTDGAVLDETTIDGLGACGLLPEEPPPAAPDRCGCSTSPSAPGAGLGAVLGLTVLLRRRRGLRGHAKGATPFLLLERQQ